MDGLLIQKQKDELKKIGIEVIEDNGKPFPSDAIRIVKACYKNFPEIPKGSENQDPPNKFYRPVRKEKSDENKCNKNAHESPQFTIIYNKTAYKIGFSKDTDGIKRLWCMKGTLDNRGKWGNRKSFRYFYHHDMQGKKKVDNIT